MTPYTYCRLGFMLLCVAPTLAMAGTIVSRHSPDWFLGSKGAWEADLTQRLGFRVTLTKVTRPHAGSTLLEGVELADRETGRLVAKARLVEAAQTDQGLVLVLSQPEILVEEFGTLAGTFHETLLRVTTEENVHLLANELLLKSAERSQTFASVEGVIEPLPAGPRATLRFRLPGSAGSELAQLRITRNREQTPPRTRWELHSGGEPLPCSMLAAYVAPLSVLGSDCEFHGAAWGEPTPGGWEGDFSGRLTKVNLDSLISGQFPHKLSGLADVTFNRARFRNGRLVDAAGSFDCGGGVIGQSLVESAAEAMQLELAGRVGNIKRWPIRFDRLAAGFSISESGLSLSGGCDAVGTILADADGSLVSSKPKHRAPVIAIARALSPDSAVLVPATAETDALLRALPIPPFSPSSNEPSRPPSATVRLKDDKVR